MLHKSSAAVVLHCGVVIFSAFPLRGRCRLRRMRCNSIAAAAATNFVGNGFIRSARTAPSYAAAVAFPLRGAVGCAD